METDLGEGIRAAATEASAAVRSAAAAVAAVSTGVEGVQHAVAARVSASARRIGRIAPPLAPAAEVTALVVAAVTRGVSANHVAVRTTTRGVAGLVETGVRAVPATTLADRPRAAAVMAVLNGALGDHLAADPGISPLSIPMGVRVAGRRVPCTPDDLAHAFEEPSPTLVVLVHGLTATEEIWPAACVSSVQRTGASVVRVRYNSGRGVAVNGAELSGLLADLVAGWPCPVERVVLVGHSMGGLVVRAACAVGESAGSAWVSRLTDAVILACPHRGSPVERWAHRVLLTLATDTVAAPLVTLAHGRSQGIKDLRFGAVLAEDWAGLSPDGPMRTPGLASRPLPPGVRHHAVVATLARDGDGLLAAVFGDGLVQPTSAGHLLGGADPVTLLRLPGTGHNALLGHPSVAELLVSVVRSPCST